ncbi:MAG: SGNH/GDSL hydrolase family protein [bacterium]|nr:SGNH/GDSL hydrolase family protein [bacterium]
MLLLVLCLILALLGALLPPLAGAFPVAAHAPAVIVMAIAALLATRILGLVRWDAVSARFLRSPRRRGALGALLAALLLFGALEACARALTAAGILDYYRPIVTVRPPDDRPDWRAYHILTDERFEADPVLFWRAVPRYPYNAQGFKGPELPAAKGPREFRIFCYGDSNTDGPDRGGWPERLQEILDRRSVRGLLEFRVVNAGLTGYSSWQGLRRFRRESPSYAPDLVLVSFGWNDHAGALGAPDKAFRSENPLVNALHGVLFRYRFYLVMKHYAGRHLLRRPPYDGPRVSPEDYLANMAGFLETARRHGAAAVLLTRPAVPDGIMRPDFLARVEAGNEALIAFGAKEGAHVLDVAGAFRALPPSLFADECHFSPDGQWRMAELLCAFLDLNGLVPPAGALLWRRPPPGGEKRYAGEKRD